MIRTIVALAALTLSVVSVPQLALAQAPAPPQFVLNGIVIPDNGRAFVWIQEPSLTQGKVIVLRPGETVGPYKLGKVDDDRVVLEGPGSKIMVPLYARAPGAPVAPTATTGRTPSTPAIVSTPGPQPGRFAGAPPVAAAGVPARVTATPGTSPAQDETAAEDKERTAGAASPSVSSRPMPYHPPSNHPTTPPVPLAQRTDLTPQDVKALSTPGITIPFGDPRTKFPSSFRGK